MSNNNLEFIKNKKIWRMTTVDDKISAIAKIGLNLPPITFGELTSVKNITLVKSVIDYFHLHQNKDVNKVRLFIHNHVEKIYQELEKSKLCLNESRPSVIQYATKHCEKPCKPLTFSNISSETNIAIESVTTCEPTFNLERHVVLPHASNVTITNDLDSGDMILKHVPETVRNTVFSDHDMSDPDDPIMTIAQTNKAEKTLLKYKTVFCDSDMSYRDDSQMTVAQVSNQDKLNTSDGDVADSALNTENVAVTVKFDVNNDEKHKKMKALKRKYSCTNLLKSFSVPKSTWSSMVGTDGKLLTTVYPKLISDCFFHISKGCVLQMKNINYYKKQTGKLLSIYCYCGHNNLSTFRIDCFEHHESKSIKIYVYTNVTKCVHPCKKTRELSGIARDIMKEQLLKTAASLVRFDHVNKCDLEGVQQNNIQGAKSYSVLRKAKSEALAVDDLHKDCLTDLFMMRDEQIDPGDRYIQHVSHPFEVIIYSNEVLNVACIARENARRKNKELVLHLDATGKVVRPIEQCEGKRVLYYCLVFQMGDNILPLSEYVTCKHSALSIGAWLIKLKEFLIDQNKWPLCNRVVTDFSWAMIEAITVQWNKMDISTYLIECHNTVNGKQCLGNKTVPVHICCCHFVKMCVNNIHSATCAMQTKDRKALKQIVLQVICFIINSTSYKRVKAVLKNLFTILLTPVHNADVQDALGSLRLECTTDPNIYDVDDENKINQETPKEEINEARTSLYRRSPFFKDVCAMNSSLFIKHGITKSVDGQYDDDTSLTSPKDDSWADTVEKDVDKNPYYCPNVAEIIAKRYVAYLPMWSGLLLKGDEHDMALHRTSNAPVENWFGQVKNVILEGQTNLRANRFARKVRSAVKARCKEITLNIPKEGCCVRGKRKKLVKKPLKLTTKVKSNCTNDKKPKILKRNQPGELLLSDDDVDVIEESWNKPPKKTRRNYFESQYLQQHVSEPFKMEHDDKPKITSLVMDNGLISDPNYYTQLCPKVNYLVCSINSPNGSKCCLTIDEIQVLRGTAWLSNTIIEAICYMLLKNDKFGTCVVIHTDIGTVALVRGERVDSSHWLLEKSITNLDLAEKIFFPLNIDNAHWVLGYANVKERVFYFLDPIIGSVGAKRTEQIFGNFLQFYSCLRQSSIIDVKDNWSFGQFNHPTQNDSYNCGIFITYFIEQLITKDSIDYNFSPDEHRHVFFKNLLRASNSMVNTCSMCGRAFPDLPKGKKDECVECTTCRRWFHMYKNCLPSDIPSNHKTLNKKEFFCHLCRLYSSKNVKHG